MAEQRRVPGKDLGKEAVQRAARCKKMLSRIIESVISFKTSRDKNARILVLVGYLLLVVKQQQQQPQQKKAMMCISVIKYQTTIGGRGGGGRLLLVIYLLISSPIYILLSTTSLFLILPFLSSFFPSLCQNKSLQSWNRHKTSSPNSPALSPTPSN